MITIRPQPTRRRPLKPGAQKQAPSANSDPERREDCCLAEGVSVLSVEDVVPVGGRLGDHLQVQLGSHLHLGGGLFLAQGNLLDLT